MNHHDPYHPYHVYTYIDPRFDTRWRYHGVLPQTAHEQFGRGRCSVATVPRPVDRPGHHNDARDDSSSEQ
jgi:hypothetical protein